MRSLLRLCQELRELISDDRTGNLLIRGPVNKKQVQKLMIELSRVNERKTKGDVEDLTTLQIAEKLGLQVNIKRESNLQLLNMAVKNLILPSAHVMTLSLPSHEITLTSLDMDLIYEIQDTLGVDMYSDDIVQCEDRRVDGKS